MSGRSASAMGGAWKRFGPIHCTGEARFEKTGSVSQKRPRSLSSTVEWPRRNSVRSGACSSWSRVRGCVGSARSGTVSAGRLKKKVHIRPSPCQKPCRGLLTALRNLPSGPGAAGVSEAAKGRGEAALHSGMKKGSDDNGKSGVLGPACDRAGRETADVAAFSV